VDRKEVADRQLDALLAKLDDLTAELKGLNRRLDGGRTSRRWFTSSGR
jgi:hypothetical protein